MDLAERVLAHIDPKLPSPLSVRPGNPPEYCPVDADQLPKAVAAILSAIDDERSTAVIADHAILPLCRASRSQTRPLP